MTDWLEREGYKVSTISEIIKNNFGYSSREEIIKKFRVQSGFLNVRLCWKSDHEQTDIVVRVGEIIKAFSSLHYHYRGSSNLLNYIVKNGNLMYSNEEELTLDWFTIEKTIKRWIKEKF